MDGKALESEEARGVRLGRIQVQLVPLGDQPIRWLFTKPDGTFTVQGVEPGRYRILLYPLPAGTWIQSVRANDQRPAHGEFEVSAGTPIPLQITLGAGGGRVDVAVKNDQGDPAPGRTVTLVPASVTEDPFDPPPTTTADQYGQATLVDLAPGEYTVYAWGSVEPGGWTDPAFLKRYAAKAQKIRVESRSRVAISVEEIFAPTE